MDCDWGNLDPRGEVVTRTDPFGFWNQVHTYIAHTHMYTLTLRLFGLLSDAWASGFHIPVQFPGVDGKKIRWMSHTCTVRS